MPFYEYRPIGPESCTHCEKSFDQLQKLAEPALQECPLCRAAVRRVISAPSLVKPGPSLDSSSLEKHGFTQYKKASKGVYEKTAGKGPNVIKGD